MIRAGRTALSNLEPYSAGISHPQISHSGITIAATPTPARGISRRAAAVVFAVLSREYWG